MKKILITGKDSYIGVSLEKWLMKEPDNYHIDTIDMKDDTWKEKDFSDYDVVFHVAGIAHIKENNNNRELYYKVNRDLAYETAKKAKEDGVKHFIFLSTMSVYGLETGIIDRQTPTKPKNAYGKSKLEAENLISRLQDSNFKVAIIRPPMVYGKGCKGNYPRLAKLAVISPIFPKVDNKRSMIYIDNLSEFIKQLIEDKTSGLFFPQNSEYVNTSKMVILISKSHNKKIKMTKLFNPLLKIIELDTFKKTFGDLIYDKDISLIDKNYSLFNLKNSIEIIEVEE